ncbi:MAG: Asp-tRNA(Asn)/Glu-tRNA(Gln) amidotransferase GatCAB subunit C [Elusimicrobia bacterium CG06_land_8_20_14_3_00_38_11]|nr:MAG: Asp-tRNA(Asn)/Glu-tRNA(Gln) amidotransferase GatCAB subunit C [Elusimicrobia bacterium CG06_land_8_20_14_3_00_38_11]
MKITIKDVEYVAKLARLSLTIDEKNKFAGQLNAILEHMDELNKLDTEGIPPTSHAVVMENVFRDDKVEKSDVIDGIISNAPEKEDRFFKVKKVIE